MDHSYIQPLYQQVSLQKGHHVILKDNIQEGLTRGQEQIFKGYVSKSTGITWFFDLCYAISAIQFSNVSLSNISLIIFP